MTRPIEIDPEEVVPPLASPVIHPLLNAARVARTRAVQCRIDDFNNLGGPIRIIADQKLSPGGRVLDMWAYASTFTINLSGSHKLPLTLRAYRYPLDMEGKTEAKETEREFDPEDPATWTEDALRRGDAICARDGWCRHSSRGYTCPQAIDLHGGEIRHGEEVWVIRRDGPPCPESLLVQTRKREAEARADREQIAHARRMRETHVPVYAPLPAPTAPHPVAGPDARVMRPGQNVVPPPPPVPVPSGMFDPRARMAQEIPGAEGA